jgi:hypothetical protein
VVTAARVISFKSCQPTQAQVAPSRLNPPATLRSTPQNGKARAGIFPVVMCPVQTRIALPANPHFVIFGLIGGPGTGSRLRVASSIFMDLNVSCSEKRSRCTAGNAMRHTVHRIDMIPTDGYHRRVVVMDGAPAVCERDKFGQGLITAGNILGS